MRGRKTRRKRGEVLAAGIPYFPLDVDLDGKFELIEAEFGITGFGVVVKILQKIYGDQGYYVEWTNDVALVFARRNGLGASAVSEIVSAAIKRGIFDEKLHKKYGILTSHGIQERYFKAVERRKNVEVKGDYLLVNAGKLFPNVSISGENVNISGKNADNREQSKEEKSKVEESSFAQPADAGSAAGSLPLFLFPLADGSTYPIYPEKVEQWRGLFPAVNMEQQIRLCLAWNIDNPKRRKTRDGILRHISSWLAKAQNNPSEADRFRLQREQQAKLLGADLVGGWDGHGAQ